MESWFANKIITEPSAKKVKSKSQLHQPSSRPHDSKPALPAVDDNIRSSIHHRRSQYHSLTHPDEDERAADCYEKYVSWKMHLLRQSSHEVQAFPLPGTFKRKQQKKQSKITNERHILNLLQTYFQRRAKENTQQKMISKMLVGRKGKNNLKTEQQSLSIIKIEQLTPCTKVTQRKNLTKRRHAVTLRHNIE